MSVTPVTVEKRLIALSHELDDATTELVAAEQTYFSAKGEYEIAIAEARLDIGAKYLERGVKVTVQEREDEATVAVSDNLRALYAAEAIVRAARANMRRLETQVDITRSVGSSVRASMEVA